MIVTPDSKRRRTVPAAPTPAVLADYFDAQFNPEEDTLVFRRSATNSDWLAVLKECPVSMDHVPPLKSVSRRLDTDVLCHPAKQNGTHASSPGWPTRGLGCRCQPSGQSTLPYTAHLVCPRNGRPESRVWR
jgi:hypothetical protein